MSTATLPRPTGRPARAAAPTEVVRSFHPGWFGAVMGTAVVGVAIYLNPVGNHDLLHAAHIVGVAFVVAAWAAAVLIAGPYLARLARHPDAALADLRHPVLGALYGTLAGAIVVLAVATATVGGSLLPAHALITVVAVLAAIGGLVAFATGVLFTYVLFTSEGMAADAANGGWFIPPVVSIIIPLTLIPLLPHVGASAAQLLLLAGYAGLGIGLFLFLLVAAVLFGRLVFHPLPPAPLAPSLWIGSARSASAPSPCSASPPPGSPTGAPKQHPSSGSRPSPLPRSGGLGSGGWPPLPSCSPATSAAAGFPTGSASGPSPSRSVPTPSPPSNSPAVGQATRSNGQPPPSCSCSSASGPPWPTGTLRAIANGQAWQR